MSKIKKYLKEYLNRILGVEEVVKNIEKTFPEKDEQDERLKQIAIDSTFPLANDLSGKVLRKGTTLNYNGTLTIPQQLTDDEKIEQLLDVILEKFKDYRTTGYVENGVIKMLVERLLDMRQSRLNELDAEENELANSMNDLIGTLEVLSKGVPV